MKLEGRLAQSFTTVLQEPHAAPDPYTFTRMCVCTTDTCAHVSEQARMSARMVPWRATGSHDNEGGNGNHMWLARARTPCV
eukprot:15481964-Alexandrium_andersonii.AAC.1